MLLFFTFVFLLTWTIHVLIQIFNSKDILQFIILAKTLRKNKKIIKWNPLRQIAFQSCVMSKAIVSGSQSSEVTDVTKCLT